MCPERRAARDRYRTILIRSSRDVGQRPSSLATAFAAERCPATGLAAERGRSVVARSRTGVCPTATWVLCDREVIRGLWGRVSRVVFSPPRSLLPETHGTTGRTNQGRPFPPSRWESGAGPGRGGAAVS